VIPASIRRELGIDAGSELLAMIADGALVMMPRSVAKARLRGLFSQLRGSLADELMAERQQAARDEDRP
jgi:bifunctional DNA-binding transcriptional regulator/antitoxin component of YhaV-PrlF toxin-antitoxin module